MAKETKYTQSGIDLWDHLRDQLGFLKNSSSAFDNGFEGEAKRLAATTRLLVHDTKLSASLLYHMGIKNKLKMLNTARPLNPKNVFPHQGLIVMKIQGAPESTTTASINLLGTKPVETQDPGHDAQRGTATYEPIILGPPNPHRPPSWVSFTRWWEEIVIKTTERTTFSRKQLVLAMANKDGGAHVDPKLNSDYANLTKFNSQGWSIETDGIRTGPDNSIADASVRQIAHELEQSLLESFGNDAGELAPFI